MKAKTFLFLGIVAVLAVLSINSASAQNGVVKFRNCNSCENWDNQGVKMDVFRASGLLARYVLRIYSLIITG